MIEPSGGLAPPELTVVRPSTVTSPAVYASELTKRYRDVSALDGLSMSVRRAEIFGFLGPNGAGKTTAVKLFLGLARPTAGDAMVLGAPAGDIETRRRIGYLPELFRYQAWLTAREVLALHCRLLELPRRAWAGEIAQSLDAVGLAERADSKAGTFSKGMQQRLGLGVALLGAPELVFLDEPTSALDPVGRHDVREIVRDLRARGTTVFLNTHLLEEAEHVCDRVLVIDRGRAIATGTIAELVGKQTTLRIKVTGLSDAPLRALPTAARVTYDTTWLTIEGFSETAVPALVAEIVARGGLIESVIPSRPTLEDRFLQLLEEK